MSKDEFYLNSILQLFPRVKFEVPFNGYFWLAMSLIWSSKNKQFSRIIWNYNWALFIIIPVFSFGIISGLTWLMPLANIHEKVYKAIFLIMGVLAIRERDMFLKDNPLSKLGK